MKHSWTVLLLGITGCVDADSTRSDEIELTTAPPATCDYPQAFGTATHTGRACPEVHGMEVVGVLPQDPDADRENAARGFLAVHESPPLTQGDWVVVPTKGGFTSIFDRSTERWGLQAYRWVPSVTAPGAILVPAWTATSDWQPVDALVTPFGYTSGYVPLFSPVIVGHSVYVPESSGRVRRLSLTTGLPTAIIDPLAGTAFSGDPTTITVNALSTDRRGNVYYAVTAFPLSGNPNEEARASWLVKVRPDDTYQRADWEAVASPNVGVPSRVDLCAYPFGTLGTPPASGPDSQAPRFACGAQRPAFNAPIAIGDGDRANDVSADVWDDDSDRKLVVLSYPNNAQGAAFLVQVDANTLVPIRASDTRGHLLHGCGVRLPLTDTCATITAGGSTHLGFDPNFNAPVQFRGENLMDSAPTIAPNGDLAIGSYDGGFSFGGGYDARGAGVIFDAQGHFVANNEEFYWEVTPSVLQHPGGSFSYLQDRNLYSALELTVGQYSSTGSLESFGTIPLDFTPNAIDFLDANILLGLGGDHYAVNGDGHAYKFDAFGHQADSVALTNADGTVRSMETLSGYGARDRTGRLYLSYAGNVYVIAGTGRAGAPIVVPAAAAASEAQRRGIAAKGESLRGVPVLAPPI